VVVVVVVVVVSARCLVPFRVRRAPDSARNTARVCPAAVLLCGTFG